VSKNAKVRFYGVVLKRCEALNFGSLRHSYHPPEPCLPIGFSRWKMGSKVPFAKHMEEKYGG
jgi:hypothetical protein